MRDNLLKLKDLYNDNQSVARIEPWSLENQFDLCKIKARESWLGFEGIPLGLWNKHVFKVIKLEIYVEDSWSFISQGVLLCILDANLGERRKVFAKRKSFR